jgi:hypothetical protein
MTYGAYGGRYLIKGGQLANDLPKGTDAEEAVVYVNRQKNQIMRRLQTFYLLTKSNAICRNQ